MIVTGPSFTSSTSILAPNAKLAHKEHLAPILTGQAQGQPEDDLTQQIASRVMPVVEAAIDAAPAGAPDLAVRADPGAELVRQL